MCAQAKRLTGLHPLAYMGVDPVTPPMLFIDSRAPTTNDSKNFNIGALWVVQDPEEVYMLISLAANIATWVQLYPGGGGGGGATTFPCDSGTANEVGGELNIFGTPNITTIGSGNTVVVKLENGNDGQVLIGGGSFAAWSTITSNDGTINITTGPNTLNIETNGGEGTDSVVTDSGTATPVNGVLNILGTPDYIETSGAGDTVTINIGPKIPITFGAESGTAQPDLNGIEFVGNDLITTTASGFSVGIGLTNGSDGQIPISGGTGPIWANLESSDGSILITNTPNGIDLVAAGGGGGGGGVKITKFTANGTWTKDAASQMVRFIGWSGGGGGEGGVSLPVSSGSYTSKGGGCSSIDITTFANLFTSSLAVTIGSGGTGGSPKTSLPANQGGTGGFTGVGNHFVTQVGYGGGGGSTGGGLLLSNYNSPLQSSIVLGGSSTTNYAAYKVFTASLPNSNFISTPDCGDLYAIGAVAGGGGQGGTSGIGGIPGLRGSSLYSLDGTVFLSGGNGGSLAGQNGSNGSNYNTVGAEGSLCGGSGGGGGAGNSTSGAGNNGGNGGNGGMPGGGGGGAGGAAGGGAIAGTGGTGARGELWIIEYLGNGSGSGTDAFLARIDTTYTYSTGNTYKLGQGSSMVTVFDDGSNFYPGDGSASPATYTAPVNGRYQFTMNAVISAGGSTNLRGYFNTPSGKYAGITNVSFKMTSACIDLNAGDVVTFEFYEQTGPGTFLWNISGQTAVPVGYNTYVSGFRVA